MMNINKKAAMGVFGALAIVISLPLMSAYESHIINVTATIENALYVHPESRDFGVMFPEQYKKLGTFVTFSASFSATDQTRVSKVDYKIVQKPKPRPAYEAQVGVDAARSWCHDNYPSVPYDPINASWTAYLTNCYPSLCPYLSKTPANLDRNDVGVPAFHNPWTAIATGSIDKMGEFVGDDWAIDLATPCFKGMCAQDWASFVHSKNPNANPNDYMLPTGLEHQKFGCDLWFEATRIY